MSDTVSIGVVGPSYWSYTAAMMASHLKRVLAQKATDPAHLLTGVYQSARIFFAEVLEASSDRVPVNPNASLSNYKIATDTLVECLRPPPESRAKINERLQEYSALLDKLERPGVLSDHDLALAQDVRDFFSQLARDGDDETYVAAVGLEEPDHDI